MRSIKPKETAFESARYSITPGPPASAEVPFDLMERHGDEAKLLAGGQTLMATLNMRLSQPALLIDITGLGRQPRR